MVMPPSTMRADGDCRLSVCPSMAALVRKEHVDSKLILCSGEGHDNMPDRFSGKYEPWRVM